MMTDPIADMLTRIRNAVRIERASVQMPSSLMKQGVADSLKREGYIWDWTVIEDTPCNQLKVDLKYGPNGEKLIQNIQRTSKPGRRVYQGVENLKPVLDGLGISILSTNKGILTDREARREKVAVEVLSMVW